MRLQKRQIFQEFFLSTSIVDVKVKNYDRRYKIKPQKSLITRVGISIKEKDVLPRPGLEHERRHAYQLPIALSHTPPNHLLLLTNQTINQKALATLPRPHHSNPNHFITINPAQKLQKALIHLKFVGEFV
jgi:hypothetical protein